MRIGILTLPLHTNYGGILQAYALQTVLERMGHDVVVFQNDYDGIKSFPAKKLPLIWGKRLLQKTIKGHGIPIFLERKQKEEFPIVTQNIHEFINKYIHTFNVDFLNKIQYKELDAIVVGSDQIWRRDYVRRIWKSDIQEAYLQFARKSNIRRIAYAASFGIDKWDYKNGETQDCSSLIKMFSGISVREDSAVKLCSKYLGVSAEHVLDPTMLLSVDDYIELIKRTETTNNQGTLFAYILDGTREKRALVDKIAVKCNMTPFSITRSRDYSQPIENRIFPTVETWLRSFYDAEMVITDSFHGCVFSIIFSKPFIAIGNIKRGMTRFLSLLKMFSLEEHLLMDVNDYSPNKLYKLPDSIENRLLSLRETSINFLMNSLESY